MQGEQRGEKDSCWHFRELQVSSPARLMCGSHICMLDERGIHVQAQPGKASPQRPPFRT